MDMVTLIQQFGFQTACCIAMGWYVWYRGNQERQDRIDADLRHKEEIDNLSQVINNNTMVIQKLIDKMDIEGVTA